MYPAHASQVTILVAAGQHADAKPLQAGTGEAAQALPHSPPPAPDDLRAVLQPHIAPTTDDLQPPAGVDADDLLHVLLVNIIEVNVGVTHTPVSLSLQLSD